MHSYSWGDLWVFLKNVCPVHITVDGTNDLPSELSRVVTELESVIDERKRTAATLVSHHGNYDCDETDARPDDDDDVEEKALQVQFRFHFHIYTP